MNWISNQSLPTKKSPGLVGLTGEFYQLKRNSQHPFQVPPPKLRREFPEPVLEQHVLMPKSYKGTENGWPMFLISTDGKVLNKS